MEAAQPSMNLWVCSISLHIDREDDFWQALMKNTRSGTVDTK